MTANNTNLGNVNNLQNMVNNNNQGGNNMNTNANNLRSNDPRVQHPEWFLKSAGPEKKMTPVWRYDGAEDNKKFATDPYLKNAPLPPLKEVPMVNISIPLGLQGRYDEKSLYVDGGNGKRESRLDQRERLIKQLMDNTVPLERFGHTNMFLDKVQEDDQIELMLRPNINFVESFADMFIGVQNEIDQSIIRNESKVNVHPDDMERRDIALAEGLKRLNLLKVADRERHILQNSATVNYIMGDIFTKRQNANGENAYSVLINAGLMTQEEAQTLQDMNNDGVPLPYLSAVNLIFIDLLNELLYGMGYKWTKAKEEADRYQGLEYLAAKTFQATWRAKDKVEAESLLEDVWKNSGLLPEKLDYSAMKVSTNRYNNIVSNQEMYNWQGPTQNSLHSTMTQNSVNNGPAPIQFTLDERKAMNGMSDQERANFMAAKVQAMNEGRPFVYDKNAITNSIITGPNASTNVNMDYPTQYGNPNNNNMNANNNARSNTSGLLRSRNNNNTGGSMNNNMNIGGFTPNGNQRLNSGTGRVPLKRGAMNNNGMMNNGNNMQYQNAGMNINNQYANTQYQNNNNGFVNNTNQQFSNMNQMNNNMQGMNNAYNYQPMNNMQNAGQQQYVQTQPAQQVVRQNLVRGNDGNLYVQNIDGTYSLYQQVQQQPVQQQPVQNQMVMNNNQNISQGQNNSMTGYYDTWNNIAQTNNAQNVSQGYDPSNNPFLRNQQPLQRVQQNAVNNNNMNMQYSNIMNNTGELHVPQPQQVVQQRPVQQNAQIQNGSQRTIVIGGTGDLGAFNANSGIYQQVQQPVQQQPMQNQMVMNNNQNGNLQSGVSMQPVTNGNFYQPQQVVQQRPIQQQASNVNAFGFMGQQNGMGNMNNMNQNNNLSNNNGLQNPGTGLASRPW